MSYFLPPKVGQAPDPPSRQGASKPRPPDSFESVNKNEEKHEIPRSSSLGHWWRNMIPSHKPERGGTARESHASDVNSERGSKLSVKPQRRATNGRRGRRSATHDSDVFTGWNIARDVSESHDVEKPSASGRRAVSYATGVGLQAQTPESADRKWSWVPEVKLPEHLSVRPPGQNAPDRKVSWQDTALEEDSAPHTSAADYLADRRLSNTRRVIQAKKEARRQRRSLKQSGDYLGVQGINPETGQLDVITPSNSDSSTDASDLNHKIETVKQVLRDSHTHRTNDLLPGHADREVKRLYLKKEKEKRAREEARKQELAARQNQGPRWKRHSKQWSSALEPALSPIAQSVRSGMSGSRRPSLPFNEMTQEGQLISFDSPGNPNGAEKELPSPPTNEASGASSKNGTVVHTRRSSAADDTKSSAAWELYENGITFDRKPELPAGRVEEKPPLPSPALSTVDHARRSRSGPDINNTQYLPFGDGLGTKATRGSGASRVDAFLGLPALGGPVSQGHNSGWIPRTVSTTDLLNIGKASTPRRSTSLFLKKQQSFMGLHRAIPKPESPQSPMTPSSTALSSMTLAKLRTPRRISELGEGAHSLEESPLHRLSPTYLLQRVRKKRMQRAGTLPIRNDLKQPEAVLEPLTKSTQAHQASDPEKIHGNIGDENKVLRQHLEHTSNPGSIPLKIQVDMDHLKKEVAGVDRLNWMKERKASDLHRTDVQWIEGTMRDITETGDRVMDEPASTLTITTTGSVPLASGLSPNVHGSASKISKSPHEPLKHGFKKLHRLDTNLTSRICPQNHEPSSLLSLTPEGQIVPIDITSAESPSWGPRQVERRHSGDLSTSTFAKEIGKENISGTKERTELTPGPKGGTAQRLGQARIQIPANLILAPESRPLKKDLKDMPMIVANLKPSSSQSLQDLIQAIPGAYPSHLEDEDDIDDPFEGLKLSQTVRRLRRLGQSHGNLWAAVKEFVFVVRCYIEVAFRLYWGITGPLFDSKSQYWVRNKSGNATLMDGVGFILAVPGAFLGLVMFV